MVVVLILISIVLQLWNSDHGHVVEACKNSLKKLQLDYLDLYLVHFPIASKHSGANYLPSSSHFCVVTICCMYSHLQGPDLEFNNNIGDLQEKKKSRL